MSVHKRTLPSGQVTYVVRWREGSANKSRSFDARKDADTFEREIRRIRQAGDLAQELQRRRLTVADMVAEWAERSAPGLASSTQVQYGRQIDSRILPQLGDRRLSHLTGADIERWIGWMRSEGAGDPTIRHACAVLQAILSVAVRDGVLSVNVVQHARKPKQQRTRVPYLIKPEQVEVMRLHLLDAGRERDAVLLQLLAYAGLRPLSEAVELRWRQVRERSLVVVDTKHHGRQRTLPMLDTLREALAEWRLRQGRPGPNVVVTPTNAGPWTEHDWRNWRRRPFASAAEAAGLPADVRPRDLRGSFVSLLVHEGRSIVEVARQLGHSPEVCLKDYAQVFDEHDPAARESADDVIRAARSAALRSRTVPTAGSASDDMEAESA